MLILPIVTLIGWIYAVVHAIQNWETILDSVIDTLNGWADAAYDAAADIIAGIVDGIKNGASKVVDALKGVATKGINAFKGMLGISSPSKVFQLQAGYTVDGYVKGLKEGEGDVSNALESMVAPEGAAAPGGTSSTSTTTAKTVHIENLTIGDGPVARENFAEFRRMLNEAFEGVSITFGGGEAPAT